MLWPAVKLQQIIPWYDDMLDSLGLEIQLFNACQQYCTSTFCCFCV